MSLERTTARLGCLLVGILCLAGTTAGAVDPGDTLTAAHPDDVLTRLLARFADQTELQAAFEERRESDLLIVPLVQTGTLHYRTPDFLEQRVEHPQATLWRLEGAMLSMEGKTEHKRIPLEDAPEAGALADALLGLFNGDDQRLQRSWTVTLEGDPAAAWQLQLRPNSRAAWRLGEMRIRGHGARLEQIRTLESDGTLRTTRLAPGP